MTKINVAYFKEMGFELILVPFDSSFGQKTSDEKKEIIKSLQLDVLTSGMKGTVVPMWKNEETNYFIAPIELHPFIRGFRWDEVLSSVNRELHLRQ